MADWVPMSSRRFLTRLWGSLLRSGDTTPKRVQRARQKWRDHCCLLGTPLQNEYNEHVKNDEQDNVENEYNEHVKNDEHVNVEIEYNEHVNNDEHVKNDEHVNVEMKYNKHVKNDEHVNVEINDKQSMIRNPRSIDSIVQRAGCHDLLSNAPRFHCFLSCTMLW